MQKYKSILDGNEDHQLIDVRPEVEFSICSLDTADSILSFTATSYLLQKFHPPSNPLIYITSIFSNQQPISSHLLLIKDSSLYAEGWHRRKINRHLTLTQIKKGNHPSK